ncbi:bifunctional phosphoribosylaminoimidazolecarboxamide formyltransferase/IMP cyclohydrolase [candidate division KSB1 bacterium]|nr:bifunctional phosphoribosylaminoimidazolecarboxamide formyltransferase/IMP cyclohydrolase [candidate division KSB1 bacterium]
MQIKRALLSVYNKTGIVEFAKKLRDHGVEICSTGGTFTLLRDSDIEVIKVSEITKFPEILDGRVKTLHPNIHGGILARRTPEHLAELAEHGINQIDMVVVNLYPFERTVAQPDVTLSAALENIDIGGPTMIRAAAKNYPDVVVVVDPAFYDQIVDEMAMYDGAVSGELRLRLALAAFQRTSQYDGAISHYLSGLAKQSDEELPDSLTLQLRKVQNLRYGENPHQRAAFYADVAKGSAGMVAARQLHGKELSYNNLQDLQAAINLALEFEKPAVAIIKHSNPCGVAWAEDVATAYEAALSTDPASAYGGIVAMNREVSEAVAEKIARIFTEVVVAPAFAPAAVELLKQKKNVRLILWPANELAAAGFEVKAVEGGLLLQDMDLAPTNYSDWKVVSNRQPSEREWEAMKFGWKVGKWVKSNAVVYVNEVKTLGIGAGQMSRVDAARLAIVKAADAGLSLAGSVVISDAFFPFRDGIDVAAGAGARAAIEPGGSVRDEEVIAAANEHDMALVFTGRRHFRH